jgi:hypothetical protein
MARPAIIWRNPGNVRSVRCWTHVNRDSKRSLYLVLESEASGTGSWKGLPTLEIVPGRRIALQQEIRQQRPCSQPGA